MKIAQNTLWLLLILFLNSLFVHLLNAQTHSNDLRPDITKLIEEVPLKDTYYEAGAVILLQEMRMTVEKDGLYTETTHIGGKILSDNAASDYGQVSIPYNSYYQEAILDFAYTIKKDGERLEVSKDAVQIKTFPELYGAKTYTDVKILTFSLPALEVGSAFEYQVSIRQKMPIITNKWHRSFDLRYTHLKLSFPPLPRIDPVFQSKLILKVPEGEEFIYRTKNIDVSSVMRKEGGFLIYTWEARDLPAVPIERNMPPIDHMLSMIQLSSLKDWKEIDQWAGGILFPRIEVTKEIKDKAEKITKEAMSDEEKIAALFYFIQSAIEYIRADLNRGGYIPHPASEVLRNQYGDCKDQVILFLSMLKAIGITAYPAFINPSPRGEINREVPSPDFSHMIVYIPTKERDLWLDTTTGVTEFPYLPRSDEDRWAFVIDGKGGKFLKTPSHLSFWISSGANSVAFSPNGRILAVGGHTETTEGIKGIIILWDMTTKKPLALPLTEHASSVESVAFSPDGTLLASAGRDGIRVWDVATQKPLGSPLTHEFIWGVFGPKGVPVVAEILETSNDPVETFSAVHLLTDAQYMKALPTIRKLTTHNNYYVRGLAIMFLSPTSALFSQKP
ncbi:MAG: DUF3857 domain-containing protein [Nitrospirota bacterium]